MRTHPDIGLVMADLLQLARFWLCIRDERICCPPQILSVLLIDILIFIGNCRVDIFEPSGRYQWRDRVWENNSGH